MVSEERRVRRTHIFCPRKRYLLPHPAAYALGSCASAPYLSVGSTGDRGSSAKGRLTTKRKGLTIGFASQGLTLNQYKPFVTLGGRTVPELTGGEDDVYLHSL